MKIGVHYCGRIFLETKAGGTLDNSPAWASNDHLSKSKCAWRASTKCAVAMEVGTCGDDRPAGGDMGDEPGRPAGGDMGDEPGRPVRWLEDAGSPITAGTRDQWEGSNRGTLGKVRAGRPGREKAWVKGGESEPVR